MIHKKVIKFLSMLPGSGSMGSGYEKQAAPAYMGSTSPPPATRTGGVQTVEAFKAGPPPPPAPPPAPPPIAGGLQNLPPPADASSQWLQMALATVGGGPDRNAYIAPFDQAATRAQQSYQTALPEIASAYTGLRDQLASLQAAQATTSQQQMANQAKTGNDTRALLASLAAPVLADIARQGQGTPTGLTGAAQANLGAAQMTLAQQAAAQQQLSQNLANAAQQSGQSRIADTELAQTQAGQSARQNLNQILNQIGLQKAGAEKAYEQASQAYQAQQANIALKAYEMQQAAAQAAAQNPMQNLAYQNAQLDLAAKQKQLQDMLNPTSGIVGQNQFITDLSRTNPQSAAYIGSLKAANLADILSQITQAADKNNRVTFQGKKLDANFLRDAAAKYAAFTAGTPGK